MVPGSKRTLFVLGGALLAVHAWRYRGYVSDDAYISLRYAQRWAQGLGLTFNDGEKVEGYTNPLWTLALGMLLRLGAGPVLAIRILGAGSALAALWGSLAFAARTISGWPLAVVPLGLAGSGALAVWIGGGLEPVSVLALFVLALGLVESPSRTARIVGAFAFVLLPQARLDAGLLAVGIVIGVSWRTGRVALVRLFLVLLAGVALATAARWRYYGDVLPNTARAKLAHPELRFGLVYLGHFLVTEAPLLPFALHALVRRGPIARAVAPALLLECAYVVAVGGDFMPGYRFLVPVAGMLVLLAAESMSALSSGPGRRYALVGCTLALATYAFAQQIDPYVIEAASTTWADDGLRVGAALDRAFAQRPLLAVDAAGAMPFASHLPTLDLLGLTDRHIARSGHAERALPGHAVGDGNYVWDRAPDVLIFNGPFGGAPTFPSGRQLFAHAGFASRYEPVRLAIGNTVTLAFVRRDGVLGPRVDGDAVHVPIWLARGVTLHPDADGQLVTDATSVSFDLPGSWRARGACGEAVAIDVRPGQREVVLSRCER